MLCMTTANLALAIDPAALAEAVGVAVARRITLPIQFLG